MMRAIFLPIVILSAMSFSACAQEENETLQKIDIEPHAQHHNEALAKTESYEGKLRRAPEFTQEDYNNPKYDDTALEGRDFHIVEAPPVKLYCWGVEQQGGAVMCRTQPRAKVKIGRTDDDFYYETANDEGLLLVGFDRDETRTIIEAEGKRIEYNLETRDYDISRLDGLPPSQVSTFTEAQLKRIRASSARKKTGFASRAQTLGFKNGFIHPVKDYTKTTNFGAQRILNGEKKRPHYGVDLAAPTGTPIYAPADGIVSLADDDLYFEGAMVLLDHGQGLISMYLHTDEILVEPGQIVKQGEQIATIGSRGRSTGPHLCWRLKWRNRNLDPELLTQWPGDEN